MTFVDCCCWCTVPTRRRPWSWTHAHMRALCLVIAILRARCCDPFFMSFALVIVSVFVCVFCLHQCTSACMRCFHYLHWHWHCCPAVRKHALLLLHWHLQSFLSCSPTACAWHMSEKFERRPFYLDAMELLDSHWAFEIHREGPWLRATPESVIHPSEKVRGCMCTLI